MEVRKGEKINSAIELIIKHVTETGIKSTDIFKLAKRAGISGRTLERAKSAVGAKSKRINSKEWLWFLTDEARINIIESMYSRLKLPVEYIDTQTDWYEELPVEYLSETEKPLDISELNRIYVICETLIFKGKYDYFAGYIPHTMESNVMKGDAFVFCSRSKSQICILQWQGDGYAMYLKRSEYGKFPWSANLKAQAVEITSEDLKMLTEYPRLMLRLSGKFTPSKIL